jgi:hypothetical protein
MKYVKVEKGGSITLPRELQQAFPALSELAVWSNGDALILKRVSPFRPTEFAERSPKKKSSLSSIVKEIHKARKG